METDIRDEIDRSFGDGPPATDPTTGSRTDTATVVRLGQRALRRRRAAVATAAAACCLVVGGAAWSALGTSTSSTGQGPAGQPTSTASDTPTDAPTAPDAPPVETRPAGDPELGKQVLVYGGDGTYLVREGTEVLEYLENPLDLRPPAHSAAFALRVDGSEVWALAEGSRTGSGIITVPARESLPTLAMWVDDQVALQEGEPTLALVHFASASKLAPEPGVEILRQEPDPDVGTSFAPADAIRSAVAEVRWKGTRWYVLARELPDSEPEYFPTAASVSRPTLEGFIEYARGSYSSGTGLR